MTVPIKDEISDFRLVLAVPELFPLRTRLYIPSIASTTPTKQANVMESEIVTVLLGILSKEEMVGPNVNTVGIVVG